MLRLTVRARAILAGALILAASAASPAAEPDFATLLQAARKGQPWQVEDRNHPLLAYLEHATLKRALGKAGNAELIAFIGRHPQGRLERELLREAIERYASAGAWQKLLELARAVPDSDDLATDCRVFAARLAVGEKPELAQAQALYRRADSLVPSCAAAFDWLSANGGLSEALLVARFEQALSQRRLDLARALRTRVASLRGAWTERSLALASNPASALVAARDWPADPALRDGIVAAVARLARQDPAAAEAHRAALSARHDFDADQQGQMQRAIAIHAAADRMPQAWPWFQRIPAAQMDEEAWAWRLRSAIQRREYGVGAAALEQLPEALRDKASFAYLGGRLAELAGDDAAARSWYERAAREATFHGFLAADRIDAPYPLCDRTPAAMPTGVKDVTLARALAWWAQGQRSAAFREWWYGLSQWSPELRRQAGLLAHAVDWHDAAVWALNGIETRNWYGARFPLAWSEQTRAQARLHGLHPSWVRGLIRAESTWNPDTRSSAGAIGLMQVMPATGRAVARRIGLAQPRLTDPEHSLRLGTAYMGELMQRYDGQIVLATAAYNAGPGAVERWPRSEDLPIDLWIETVTYRETREYVPRVLAFKVIYDWRADGIVTRLSDRIAGLGQSPARRVQTVCSAELNPHIS